jgi:nitroreductase
MATLDLSPDQLLSTTRAVRRRLDFDRPVPDGLIRECVDLALQAPSSANQVSMQFVIVRDEALRVAVAEQYRAVYGQYRKSPRHSQTEMEQPRLTESSDYLAANLAKAPVYVLGCNTGRTHEEAAKGMDSILPAMWSFMLAARARGLGTAWTTAHRQREREIAQILDIPYEQTSMAVLTPLAFTIGLDFKPAHRPPADDVMLWR